MKSRVLPGFLKSRSNSNDIRVGDVAAFVGDLGLVAPADVHGHYRFKKENGHTRGFVQLICTERLVQIHRLWAIEPGNGCGSVMMRLLCEIADRHGVEMKLKVIPIGRKPYPLSRGQLKGWYQRFGFEGAGWVLFRKPAGTPS